MKTTLNVKHCNWLVLLGLLFVGFANAQKGEVIGVIADEIGSLPGATVSVKETTIGTVTDLDGNFRLLNVPVGNQILVVAYLGYETTELTIKVTEGSVNVGSIELKAASNTLQEVVLQGNYLPSQQKALNLKKHSIAIMEVMASDAIGKLPDRNAAEAVQRMSGVSIERDHGEGRYVIVRGTPTPWNSTLLNGNRMPSSEGTSDNTSGTRAAPLDIFPSEMIEYVQLAKAITPDMEGDAIGGSVNFITRTAPNKRTLNVNLGYGYNNQAQKPTQSASITYGDKLANGKIGFMLSGTYWNRNWGTDNYEVSYNEDNLAINELQLRDYLGARTTYGLNAGFEYTPNTENKLYFRGMYTDFQDNESAVEHLFNFEDSEMGVRVRNGIIGITLNGGELGGNHKLGNGKFGIDWKVATYTSEMDNRKPDWFNQANSTSYYMATFSAPVTYNNLTADGYKFLDIDSPSGYAGDHFDNIQPNMASAITSGDLALDNQIAYGTYSYEQDYTAQLDLSYQPSDKLRLKTGFKFKTMDLERGAPYDYYLHLGSAYGAPVYMTDFETRPFPSRGGYLTEINSPYNNLLVNPIKVDQLDQLFSAQNLENPLYYAIHFDEENPSSAGSFYTGNETVTAAYIMGDYDISKNLKIIGGIRYEHTNLDYKGNVVTTNDTESIITKTDNSNDFGSFLPMVHLKYTPKENLNIRLAYTRTFARANFSDLNPTETRSLITSPNTIARGNINLEPTYSNNFDIMGEYFFENVGLLSGGVFYKGLENVIYTARSYATIDGDYYQITQPQNSEKGWLAGFEVGFSKRLTFLPGFLSGFGVEGNYTYADSQMDVPEYATDATTGTIITTTTTEKIPNQSQHIFNTSIFYEKGKFTVRLAGNYKGESLAVVQGNPENYRWYDKNFTIDVSASYSLTKNLKMYVELNNLTNEPLRYYQGTSNRPEQTEYYSLRGMFGINYKIF